MHKKHLTALLALVLVAGLTACSDDDDDDPMAPPPPPPPGESTLRTATFRGASGHHTEGTAAIVLASGAHRLDLGADFLTESAAETQVKLCDAPDCSGSQLDLGFLKAVRGAQSYALPDASTQFAFVVIWCRPYAVPFGYGELR